MKKVFICNGLNKSMGWFCLITSCLDCFLRYWRIESQFPHKTISSYLLQKNQGSARPLVELWRCLIRWLRHKFCHFGSEKIETFCWYEYKRCLEIVACPLVCKILRQTTAVEHVSLSNYECTNCFEMLKRKSQDKAAVHLSDMMSLRQRRGY